ncbi:MAG: FkbM family methyltransferase [Ginsengibacter sp.]
MKYSIINTHDSVGRDLFFDGIYEPRTIRIIEKNLSEGDVMIDAGANIGAISLPIAKKKNVTIFGFEPAHHIYKTLQKNIVINKLKNMKALPLALSNEAGEVDFYESDRVHGWSGIVKIDSFLHYKVPATTLDSFTKENNIEEIAVLKVDVQGWEYFVLKGAEELINQKKIKNIIFEFEWWAEKNAGLDMGAAQNFLLSKGYALQTLDGRPLTKPLTSGSVIIHATI